MGAGMSSFYNRREQGEVTVFTVTPAPYPGDKGAGQIFALGVAMICVGVVLLIFVVGIAFIGLGIAWIIQSRNLKKRCEFENAHRTPKDIKVSASGVAANGYLYEIENVVEVMVSHHDAGPSRQTGKAVADLKNAQAFVSYQVSVRLRSDSRPIVLMGGLTSETARSLAQDISTLLTKARAAR